MVRKTSGSVSMTLHAPSSWGSDEELDCTFDWELAEADTDVCPGHPATMELTSCIRNLLGVEIEANLTEDDFDDLEQQAMDYNEE